MMLTQIEELKKVDYFPEEEWDERGLIPSDNKVVLKMKENVNGFLNFLLSLTKEGKSDDIMLSEVQSYFDKWDRGNFDTEEMEFIFDEFFIILRKLGINGDKLVV